MSEILKIEEDDAVFKMAVAINNLLQSTTGTAGIVFEEDNFKVWYERLLDVHGWLDSECLGVPPTRVGTHDTFCDWRALINAYIDGYVNCVRPLLNPPPGDPALRIQGTLDGYQAYISPNDIHHTDFAGIKPPKIGRKSYFDLACYDPHRVEDGLVEHCRYGDDPSEWPPVHVTLRGDVATTCIQVLIPKDSAETLNGGFDTAPYPLHACYIVGDKVALVEGNEGYHQIYFETIYDGYYPRAGYGQWLSTHAVSLAMTDRDGDLLWTSRINAADYGASAIYVSHIISPSGIRDVAINFGSVLLESGEHAPPDWAVDPDGSLVDLWPYLCHDTYAHGYEYFHPSSGRVQKVRAYTMDDVYQLYIGGLPRTEEANSHWMLNYSNQKGGHRVSDIGDQWSGIGPISNFIIQAMGHWPLEERQGYGFMDVGPYGLAGHLVPLIPVYLEHSPYLDLNFEESCARPTPAEPPYNASDAEEFPHVIPSYGALAGGSVRGSMETQAQKKLPIIVTNHTRTYTECIIQGTKPYPSTINVEGPRAPTEALLFSFILDISRMRLTGWNGATLSSPVTLASLTSKAQNNRRRRVSLQVLGLGEGMGSLKLQLVCEYFKDADPSNATSSKIVMGPYTLSYTTNTRIELRAADVVDFTETTLGAEKLPGVLVTLADRVYDFKQIAETDDAYRFVDPIDAEPMAHLVVGGLAPFYNEPNSNGLMLTTDSTYAGHCIFGLTVGSGRAIIVADDNLGEHYKTTEYIRTYFRCTQELDEGHSVVPWFSDADASNKLDIKGTITWITAFPEGSTGVTAEYGPLDWGHSRLNTHSLTSLSFWEWECPGAAKLWLHRWFTPALAAVDRSVGSFPKTPGDMEVNRKVSQGFESCSVTDNVIYPAGVDISGPDYVYWAGVDCV